MKQFLSIVTLISFVSCGGGGGPQGLAEQRQQGQENINLIQKSNLFEVLLEESGDSYKLVKYETEQPGYVVFHNLTKNEFVAYNLTNFKQGDTLSGYLASHEEGVDIVGQLAITERFVEDGYWKEDTSPDDVRGFCDQVGQSCEGGYYWVDTSGMRTFYTGGGFEFSNNRDHTKDLELIAFLDESQDQEFIATTIKNKFSLSAARSDELARTVIKHNKISNKRALTESELDILSKDAFGSSYAEIQSALVDKIAGDEAHMNEILDKAAKVNKTTSENISGIFEMYLEQ